MKFHSNKVINTIIYDFIIVLISIMIFLVVYYFKASDKFHNSIYDNFFRISNSLSIPKKVKSDEIVIVAIDDYSLQIMSEQFNLWPWSRNYYGAVASHMIGEGAKAVLFDIIFSSGDIDRMNNSGGIEYGYNNDSYFSTVINETGKVIIAYNIDKMTETEDTVITLPIENASSFRNIAEYKSIMSPYTLFRDATNNLGFVDINAESDGIVRQYTPFVKIKNKYYPSLAGAAYLLIKEKKMPDTLKLNEEGNFIINWQGPGGINKTFTYYPFWKVFADFLAKKRGKELKLPENAFKDKVVFVGASARGLLDMKSTPFTKDAPYPGVEIHANALLNLLNKNWITENPIFIEIPVYFILLLLITFFGINSKTPIRYSMSYLLLIIIVIAVHFYLFAYFRIMSHTALFIFMAITSFLLSQVVNYITVGHDQLKIKNTFSAYLSPDLVKQIADSDEPLSVNGKNVTATAVFIDIAGFTTYSEKNPVEKVVAALNLYLQKFSEVIMDNKGYVNKYLGDGLMALFGAIPEFDDHADMAVKSALEIFKIKNELKDEYGLDVRIGVNSGPMIVGNMGGGKKLEYTSIGDSVNTASRLEGSNKFFGTNITIGENTKNLLKNDYDLNYVGKFGLKGKDIPYGIYIISDAPKENRNLFNEIITAYEGKNLDIFKEKILFALKNKINFGPIDFYKSYYEHNSKYFGEPIKFTEK